MGVVRALLCVVVLIVAGEAAAQMQPGQNWPARPVKLIVATGPGLATDIMARLLSEGVSRTLGQQMFVENMPGASGIVGAGAAARAPNDGYTFFFANASGLTSNMFMIKSLPYDPTRDYTPVAMVCDSGPFVVAVHPDLPVKTLAELIAYAKAQPGKLSYGHAGVGTSQHLGAELFKYMAHVDIAAVPYRGTTALMPDLLAGRITMSFANIVNVLPLAREGKLRALAITSIKRSALAPDLPTMAESGFPGFEAVPWFGLLAPSGTPKDVLDKLYGETVKTLAMPEVRKKFDELGLEPVGNTPAEFAAVIRKETPEWAKVIKDAGIKLGN